MSKASTSSQYLLTALGALLLAGAGCGSSSTPDDVDSGLPQGTIDAGPGATADAMQFPDGGTCTPGADTLLCADSKTLSLCTDDPDFDGMKDGDPVTTTITCKEFFLNAGEASCETFNASSSEALCTMDNGGPCGVRTITGAFTTARCTVDDAICLLDPNYDNGPNVATGNYLCSPNEGISCSPTGSAFVPFCSGTKLVWRCTDDSDGTGLPRVDDCTALGNGTCDAASNKCINLKLGATCNTTEWICDTGLKCQTGKCVAE